MQVTHRWKIVGLSISQWLPCPLAMCMGLLPSMAILLNLLQRSWLRIRLFFQCLLIVRPLPWGAQCYYILSSVKGLSASWFFACLTYYTMCEIDWNNNVYKAPSYCCVVGCNAAELKRKLPQEYESPDIASTTLGRELNNLMLSGDTQLNHLFIWARLMWHKGKEYHSSSLITRNISGYIHVVFLYI